jgi:hypothetical protein
LISYKALQSSLPYSHLACNQACQTYTQLTIKLAKLIPGLQVTSEKVEIPLFAFCEKYCNYNKGTVQPTNIK